jgi:hypothetical protein
MATIPTKACHSLTFHGLEPSITILGEAKPDVRISVIPFLDAVFQRHVYFLSDTGSYHT